MESRHSLKESNSWQTKEIADAIPKRIAARTRARTRPDAARKTIHRAAAADLREALRVRRARRAAAKAAKAVKAPSRSGVPVAVKRKALRAAPEAGLPREAVLPRDAGLRGAALREATTKSRRSLFPFLTGLPSEARFLSGSGTATVWSSGSAANSGFVIERYGRDGAWSPSPSLGSSTERDLWMSVSFSARSTRRT
jgi:hypothetical protein